MARPRKNDPRTIILPMLHDFASEISAAVEKFTISRVSALIGAQSSGNGIRNGRRKRATVTCYYPGCKNVAAPRFGMFCAALHKGLPKADKARYRALRLKEKKQVRKLPPKR